MEFDGFNTEAGTHVVNFTESADDLIVFVDCVDPEENAKSRVLRRYDNKFVRKGRGRKKQDSETNLCWCNS